MTTRSGKLLLNEKQLSVRIMKSEENLIQKHINLKPSALTCLPNVINVSSTNRTSPDRLDSLRFFQNTMSQSNMFFTSQSSPLKPNRKVASMFLSNQKDSSVQSPMQKKHIRNSSLVKILRKEDNGSNQVQLSACKLYLTFLNKKEYKSCENKSLIQEEIKLLRTFYQVQSKKNLQVKIDPLFGEFIDALNQQRQSKSPAKGQRGSIFLKSKDSLLNLQFIDQSNNDDISEFQSESSPKNGKSILTDKWNIWYFRKCYDQIKDLRDIVKDLLLKINSLQELWKNDDRVQRFLRKELHQKTEIYRKLFKQGKPFDSSISHNTLMKMLQDKEIQYYNNKPVPIYRYQFKLKKDLADLRDTISNILHMSQINGLKSLRLSIENELIQVKKMELQHINQFSDRLSSNQIIFDQRSTLSYFSPCMHYETRDIMLEKAERYLGNFIHPSNELREINDNIKTVLNNLRHQDEQNKKEQ